MTSTPIHSSAAITDFLNRSLTGGALAVGELEAKARAAGLLREHQQIQHAKAFKKVKKALGIRSVRDGFGSGGKWAWLMPAQVVIGVGSVANSPLNTKEQHSVRNAELPCERLAALESRCIVQQWIEGVQRLDYVRSPHAVLAIRWHLFLGDCHGFMSSSENWPGRAAALGWNALALFGCHRSRPLEHLGSAGLLWAINGGNLAELYRDWAVIERRQDKSRQVYHRRRQDEAQVKLPWIGLRAKNRDSIGDQIFLELPAAGHLWGALYEEHGQLVGTRTSIRGPADHRCPGVADGSVLTWVTYGKQVPADTKFTECHQIGFMRTVRARACARVMGSYWDYDD